MEAESGYFSGLTVDAATREIFNCIMQERDKKVIYFNGWYGFGAAAVLRSVAQEIQSIKAKKTPPELCFDRIIYIDGSAWESRREIQRKIAEELGLGHETAAMFRKQDDEDDFSGVDHGRRDVIRSVSEVIGQTLWSRKCMMIFLNGSVDEVDPSRFGFSPNYSDHVIVWTFRRQSLTINNHGDEIKRKLRYTHLFFETTYGFTQTARDSFFLQVLAEEAADIVARHPCMWGMDRTVVTDCCLYELFLHCSFHKTIGFDWVAHASNYWMCEGIIKNAAKEIISTLHQEIRWEYHASLLDGMLEEFPEDAEPPFLVVKDDVENKVKYMQLRLDRNEFIKLERPYCRWISVTSKNLRVLEDNKATLLKRASSLFVAPEIMSNNNSLQVLENGFLNHCASLRVLVLSCCAFSFLSPPFLQCHGLRFLGLDHCKQEHTSDEEQKSTAWTCLCSLLVLDIRYTDWDEILSEEKMDLMVDLRELNIEGVCSWQYTSRLQGRLPNLQRLRIIKPRQQMKTSTVNNDALMGKTGLEILDLSGNKDMENIPTSLSKARSLQALILDGCEGLENVSVPDGLPSLLRSFSFDGYGPAARWTSSVELPPLSSRPIPVHGTVTSWWTSVAEQPPFEGPAVTSLVDLPLKGSRETDDVGGHEESSSRKCKCSKISLQGCTQLQNLFVRGLPSLVELDLSGSAIKVLDLEAMVVDVPGLKRIFLLGCEHLRAIKWGSFASNNQLEFLCIIDTRPGRRKHRYTRPSLAQHKSFRLQLHAILADSRLARSLDHLVSSYDVENICFNIHITSSTECGVGVEVGASDKERIQPDNQQRHVQANNLLYGDAFSKIGDDDTPLLVFPQPPTQQLDRHVEISDGSRGLDSELARFAGLGSLMRNCAESLHVHDASTSACMPELGSWSSWFLLKWFRVERCSNLRVVFPAGTYDQSHLQTIWVSDLRMARCIWSNATNPWLKSNFNNLRHVHLKSCPRMQFVMPVTFYSTFPRLQTLHIIHCSDLSHIFSLDDICKDESDERKATHCLQFPELTTIYLHDLPKLRQICVFKMSAPALKTVRVRGCFGLRRLPAVAPHGPGVKRPTVEMEKDVWDALEWDGLAAGHHPSLFEPLVHSRYYKTRHLRTTVLR